MASRSYIDAFIPIGKEESNCVNCGICLQKCPVLKMGKEESKAEIKRLLNGEAPQRVLDECTFCFSCNHYCPQGLKPYALIMERMTAKNRESGKGIPEAVQYMFTGKNASGYFYDIYNAAPQEDKVILDRWSQVPPKAKDTLFIGCFGRTIPQGIENSKTLAGLAKFAGMPAAAKFPTVLETIRPSVKPSIAPVGSWKRSIRSVWCATAGRAATISATSGLICMGSVCPLR